MMRKTCKKRTTRGSLILLAVFFLVFSGCAREIIEKRVPAEDALVPVKGLWKPKLRDDMDKDSLRTAVKRSIAYLTRLPLESQFRYGPHTYTAKYLIESMNAFRHILATSSNQKDLNKRVRRNFHIYKSIGSDGKGSVVFTGYYEPILRGSRTRSDVYRYPIYMKPNDLMVIHLEQFHPRFKNEKIVARYDRGKIVPYYNREEIEEKKVLEGNNLEMLWISDPVDLFFMQIQGSGVIAFENEEFQRVHYAGTNGRPYRSIGRRFIKEKILPKEEVSFQTVKAYLKDHPEERDAILNHNESYIFFEKVGIGPLGNIEVVLTPGRSIATDYRLFPRGGLSFISSEKPEIDESNTVTGWTRFSRFVVNQDTGGAITGPGRVDLFWGTGGHAEVTAGAMYKKGEMYFLVKKP